MKGNKAKTAASNGRNAAKGFHFRLLAHEKGYKRMINSINSHTPYRLILEYFERMAQTDKPALLKTLIEKGDEYSWNYRDEEGENEEPYFPALLEKMVSTYGKPILLSAIKQAESRRYHYRASRFLTFMKDSLTNS